jgi:hypothetical protein
MLTPFLFWLALIGIWMISKAFPVTISECRQTGWESGSQSSVFRFMTDNFKRYWTIFISGCSQVMWPLKWLTCGLNRMPVHLRCGEFIRQWCPLMRLESEPFITLNIEYLIQKPQLDSSLVNPHFRETVLSADWADFGGWSLLDFSVHKWPVMWKGQCEVKCQNNFET